jgi:DNA-binding transcriptional LysR family regulator
MVTINQLETFYWMQKLGSLQAAADKLHISPSAVSKRLQELERQSSSSLFNISRRGVILTTRGQEILEMAEDLLGQLSQLDALKSSPLAATRVVSIGVTEIVVLTWFSAFVARLSNAYPNVSLHPEVDLSAIIRDKILSGQLDFAVLPEQYVEPGMTSMHLGTVKFSWFCQPGALPKNEIIPLQRLAQFPLIEQGPASGITTRSRKMFAQIGVEPQRISGTTSMVALAALIESGMGVSCLPKALFTGAVKARRLQEVKTDPPAPSVNYHAVFLAQHHSAIGWTLANIARLAARFSRP